MKTARFWWLGLGVLAASACGPSLQVRTDFDQAASFTRYRTYRMGESKLIGRAAAAENTLVKDRIDAELRSQLAAEGLRPADTQAADLVVKYAVGARTVRELQSSGYMTGPYAAPYAAPYGSYGSYGRDMWVTEVPEGMLVIDLVDAHTQKLVWRAYCRAEGEGMNKPEFIKKAVAKAFEKYPPAPS